MIHYLIGFVIALAVGLTGIGGGSFTVPALVLIVGLPANVAVGTAFVYAGVIRLIAAPFYLLGKHIHGKYLWLLLQGAIPGLLIGTYLLRLISHSNANAAIVFILGVLLTTSSLISFVRPLQNPQFARKNSHWLRWFSIPIGIEAGFSSAGAGILGTLLLLNYSEIPAPQVVGTDLLFGLALAVIGSALHWQFGSLDHAILLQLLEGGIPGVLLGCALARVVPARKLKTAIALIAVFAGLQLLYSGTQTLFFHPAPVPKSSAPSPK